MGSSLQLDGEPYTVIGVLPQGFEPPFDMEGVALWKPPRFDPADPEVRGWRGFRAVRRLGPGVGLPAAQQELTALYAGIARTHEEVNDEWRLAVYPLLDRAVGDTRPVLLAFLGAAGFLLLIVCANVANLLLARGLGRRQELAVRAALGADRVRLVGGLLAESLVLSLTATVIAAGPWRRRPRRRRAPSSAAGTGPPPTSRRGVSRRGSFPPCAGTTWGRATSARWASPWWRGGRSPRPTAWTWPRWPW